MKIIFSILFFIITVFADVDFKKEIADMKSIGQKVFDKNEKADLIMIDFWASWCDPCKESFPYYDEKVKNVKGKTILFISINMDEKKEKAEAFLKAYPQKHVVVWDKEKTLIRQLKFEAVPYLFILDKDWKLIESVKGFDEKTRKYMSKYF